MKNYKIPANTLLHTFGLYNAIVIASDGTHIKWNNTLGFSKAKDSDTWPIVDVSDMPNIKAEIEFQTQNRSVNFL